MDKIQKLLRKIGDREQRKIGEAITRILSGQLADLDIKKLVNSDNLYRARVGNFRIVFYWKGDDIGIVELHRRSEHTYD